MGKSIFEEFNTNPVYNMFGGQQSFQSRLAAFANEFGKNSNSTPEQVVRQMVSSGQMTQEQFNRFSLVANQLIGRKF